MQEIEFMGVFELHGGRGEANNRLHHCNEHCQRPVQHLGSIREKWQ